MVKIFISLSASLIVASQATAAGFVIKDDLNTINLDLREDELSYKDQNFSKKIKRMNCNRHAFDQFASRLNHQSKALIVDKEQAFGLGAIRVAVAGENRIALRHSHAGLFFRRLPSNILNLYITSQRLCRK